jgi:hypothetical protein
MNTLNSYIKRERKVKNSLTPNLKGSIEVIYLDSGRSYTADVLLDQELKQPELDKEVKEFIPMTWGFILKLDNLKIKYRWS